MRAIFGVLSLLVVVAIVSVLAKKQLSPASAVRAVPAGESVTLPVPQAGATPQQQSQQIQQQVRQSLENTLQQARPMPEGE